MLPYMLLPVHGVSGTEQHRHNTAEVAVYSLLSYMWEMEVGERYVMTKVT